MSEMRKRLKITLLVDFLNPEYVDPAQVQDNLTKHIEASAVVKSVDQCIARWTNLRSKKEGK